MTNSNPVLPSEGVLKTNSTSTNVVNIRSTPVVKDGNIIRQGKSGDRVKILDKQKPSGDTRTWYKVQFGTQAKDVGWVREDVISIVAKQPTPDKNPSEADTLVYFVTDTKTVRVYGKGQAYINVYDNKSETTNRAPAAKLPKTETNSLWTTYIASKDGYTYQVRFIPGADTELTIIQENKVILQQKGFRADGSEYRP
ncbi:MAG: SH3 domain-containing protein [Aulosira sp. ZfuVER01]|nr:SH3 domain-containing protein [Aulosira sp. ZfuVER01]MDZ8002410.1 SH3 domain-containing protein [Aulosira sp. DedVER01a]MDZ8054147.1 SH3 domain-containing protein [Aulosira sp. ZfuCHP01]